MVPKVFVTGSTGYIGGDALFEIIQAHPNWDIACLVRNKDKGIKIAQQYPSVRLAYGDLDAVEVIEEEASKAVIVYHFANCDHEPSAKAIARGLARRNSSGPGYWIHTSGALSLSTETIERGCYGDELAKVFDDWDGIDELTSLPDHAEHRSVDKIVLESANIHPGKVKTAIISPPVIYGRGRGPDNQRSVQAYRAAEAFMKHQRAFKVGNGRNVWHQVHVWDLSKLYLLLGEAAASGSHLSGWNDQGYYLAESGSFIWGEFLKALAEEVSKKSGIEFKEAEQLSPEMANKLLPYAKYLIGTNSRGTSIRAKRLLGWEPRERSLVQEIPSIVEWEISRFGIPETHAPKVKQ